MDGSNLIIEYYVEDIKKVDCYMLKINASALKAVKDVVVTEHTSSTRTKEEIKAKSEELSIKYTGKDIYKVEPKITSPYVAGELKEQVETDTLNQINYFRYLAGLNGVKINETENRKYMN